VEDGAVVDGVICDKRCVIGRGARVGADMGNLVANEELPGSLQGGATVLGMDVHVPAGGLLGKNCIIYPKTSSDLLCDPVASGRTVRGAAH